MTWCDAGTPDARDIGVKVPARVLMGGEHTGGRFALVEVRERRGAGPPRHVHHREDEVIYVLAGEVTFYRGDERIPGPAGTCMLLPRGCEHSVRIESDDAHLLISVAPAGFEEFYREPEWGRGETAIEWLIAVAARYGVEITGPPPGP